MKKDKLKDFINKPEELEDSKTIKVKDGLYERIDVKLVTKEGKQLLKEQLYEKN